MKNVTIKSRSLTFICAVALCCLLVSCSQESKQTVNESKYSPVCKTDNYYYDKQVSQIQLTVFAINAGVSEQWELQLFKNQGWISVQSVSPVHEDNSDVYSFTVPKVASPLKSGQYRLYDRQNLYASNTFAVGELSEFLKGNLDVSNYSSNNNKVDISLSVEYMTKQFLLYSMVNLSNHDLNFGCGAWLEIQLGNEWYSLPEHIMFEMVNQHLAPGEEYREIIYLGAYDVPLCAGKYRIVKEYDVEGISDSNYAYTEFHIEPAEMEDTPVIYDALQVVTLSDKKALLNRKTEYTTICYPEIISLDAAEKSGQQKNQTHYHLWCDIAPNKLSYTFPGEFSDEECLLCLCYSKVKGIFWAILTKEEIA